MAGFSQVNTFKYYIHCSKPCLPAQSSCADMQQRYVGSVSVQILSVKCMR